MDFSVEQAHIHPSGVQQWNTAVIDGSQDYFAFCSTLSIYVYSSPLFQLKRLIAGHDKCISCLVWCRTRSNQFATACYAGVVNIWDIDNPDDPKVHSINVISPVYALDWDPKNSSTLIISTKTSSVYLWDARKEIKDLKSMELWNNRNESNPAKAGVLRWHPTDSSTIAAGNSDGSIRLFDLSTKTLTKVPPIEKGVAVADMRWDPASDVYMLVCNVNGAIRLMDVTTMENVRTYEREAHVQTISWLGWAPGNFSTCNVRTGVVKVWNVSQSKPIEHRRVGHTGFQSCHVVPGTSRAICSFVDGSVTVFDMKKKQREFITPSGHTETVFGCEYSPSSPDIMATSSYDSTVKIWDTGTMSLQNTLVGQSGVIYSMAWSNCGTYLASSSIKGSVFIWDTHTGEALQKLSHHKQQPAYCVDWSKLGSCLLASTGADNSIVVFKDDGLIHRRFVCPDSMYGVQWHPKMSNILVAGCADGCAYIFDTNEDGKEALKHCLIGHEQRVFHTTWSPMDSTLLATGSDDLTIRIWNVQLDGSNDVMSGTIGRHPSVSDFDCQVESSQYLPKDVKVTDPRVLLGHNAYVRPLLWHPEVPHLLISGSWDGSIRLWDTRLEGTEACLSVGRGHLADVYGLSIHPDRPFVLASTSRDSTVRLWTLGGDTNVMLLSALRDKRLDDHMDSGVSMLTGDASRKLNRLLKTSDDVLEQCTAIYNFFGGKTGVQDFWVCVSQQLGDNADDNLAGMGFGVASTKERHIFHKNEIVSNASARAQNLESIKMRRTSMGGGIGGMKKDEQIRAAAELYAQCGDLQKYCDIMFDDLGEHERALAVAPGVSLQYWQELSAKYARILAELLSEDSVPFFNACGKSEEAVKFYSKRAQFREAFLVAAATNMGSFPTSDSFEGVAVGEEAKFGGTDSSSFILRTTSSKMAAHYQEIDEPILAATSFMASDDFESALNILLQDDILLAFALHLATGVGGDGSSILKKAEDRLGSVSTQPRRKSVKLGVESSHGEGKDAD
ncbi:hypothetical protein TrST_g12244 [Triparma strigata]|uniref:Anaphase-promoting complex subunit 4-like WD40 domain-containing protein n=1 Tax=Triparma strigata TaxID=1606541 RepID=A0A9W7BA10_9STRA|nr:hypothetical protein TrST_g12244 [Triparma strigata]